MDQHWSKSSCHRRKYFGHFNPVFLKISIQSVAKLIHNLQETNCICQQTDDIYAKFEPSPNTLP